MNITNNFSIPSSGSEQGRVGRISKDPQQQEKGQEQSSLKAMVVAPDEQGTDNAKAYQQFIREDGNAYSQQAIASYTSFEKLKQRESIQSMFGVDIYA
ncbi:hypothetical protein KUL152_19870 [Tenacibaculum sp. KUL152]|jgi:hypothetical protein|uniref:hypothetical protein n=1 Tax=unclassified Alteromonas TaxID=2614992 RepID=UPI0012E4E3BA|nr:MULTISPECIES: hypothetical protein [unclassified Alteromonas]WDT84806.1 hypothetical protein OZ660_12750 [Alteromonas sp. 009811495]BCO19707.1 hypothetical protein KUC3_25640 [Alteromonas sp. KC3]BCO23673.1 hypothetical protein KUC14_25420 [Alteromonas sp. KC14]GFD89761.1 hypothetical protein KUL152_19870 [Tenacibaculum sp. KUL152]